MFKFSHVIVMITVFAFLFSVFAVLITTQDAEAGPTEVTVKWRWYKCSDTAGNVCIPWMITMKDFPKESLWHKWFGAHPHGTNWFFEQLSALHQVVVSCSQCNFGW